MGNWSEKNISEIQEYPFDFQRYIEERLREIDDLDERKFAKTVLLEGLSRVISSTDAKYQQLEQRIYEEIEIADNCYESVMTVVKRSHYDPTNGTLYPVILEDLDIKKLAELFPEEDMRYWGTIFLEKGYKDAQRFLKKGQFSGKLEKNGVKREARFYIKPAARYRDIVETMYQVFQDNHILWETMNTGYLDLFFDVFVERERMEPGEKELPTSAADIRFGEFSPYVRYDLIPLWNIERVTFDSADFMVPCINGIDYEHEFSLMDKNSQDGYLIKSNEDILEIRHEQGRIAIKSQTETFEGWEAIRLIQGETRHSLDYEAPLLTNHKNDTFFRRYASNNRVRLMTKTDLFRRIMELDVREYIEVVGYEICDNDRELPMTEGMNWFMRDELFPMESRKVLMLKFEEKNPKHYLNDTMVRFVLSQMQLEISEYRCVGVIV